MTPALSVIFFTTASGAGYRLLALLGLLAPFGLVSAGPWFGIAALVLALALVSVGLLSSTLHLGHPERAWRAVSQRRSSPLARDWVAALVTYLPVLGFGTAQPIRRFAIGRNVTRRHSCTGLISQLCGSGAGGSSAAADPGAGGRGPRGAVVGIRQATEPGGGDGEVPCPDSQLPPPMCVETGACRIETRPLAGDRFGAPPHAVPASIDLGRESIRPRTAVQARVRPLCGSMVLNGWCS